MPIGAIWQTALETPLINIMVAMTVFLGGSYGLAILAFTVLSRVLMFPLTLRMLHSMKALQDIQPQMQEIQKKYTDPRRRQEEVMKLYRESGVNPLGCLGPQLIQFPIFIALYQVIRLTLGTTPEAVLDLSHRLYDYPLIQNAIPLSSTFLGMDLAAAGNYILVVLVFCSMWLQQRISTSRSAATATSEQQQQMNTMMQWMLPAMFSWFVIAAPAGVGLYWVASTVIGIVLQWVFVGPGDFTWGSLLPDPLRARLGMRPASHGSHRRPAPRAALSQHAATPDGASTETRTTDARSGDERQDGRRGNRTGSQSAGPAPRSSRRRRHH